MRWPTPLEQSGRTSPDSTGRRRTRAWRILTLASKRPDRMTDSLDPSARTRLEKVAVDNGFDLEQPRDGAWLALRIGEALGLQWADIDLKAGTLAVKRALERSGGDAAARRALAEARRTFHKRYRAAAPRSVERQQLREEWRELQTQRKAAATVLHTTVLKTERSARTLSLPPVVVTALKSHHARQREEGPAAGCSWPESPFVFCALIGTPVDPRHATRDFHAMRREGPARLDPFPRSAAHGRHVTARAGGRSPHDHADPRALPDQPDDEHLHARPPPAPGGRGQKDERHSRRRIRNEIPIRDSDV